MILSNDRMYFRLKNSGWIGLLLLVCSSCYVRAQRHSTPQERLMQEIRYDPALLHGSQICCLMVNDNQLTSEAKGIYRDDIYAVLKGLLEKRYSRYSDTLQVRYVSEELQCGFYSQLIAIRLFGDSVFQEINDLAIHYHPDTVPIGTVHTQLSLHFEEVAKKFYFLYEFGFRTTTSDPWTTKRWKVEFEYCESIGQRLIPIVVQDAIIPPELLTERRGLAAAELRSTTPSR